MGIMEKRSPFGGTLPSNGLRFLTSLLTLYGLTCLSSNQVVVPEKMNAVVGKNITLACRIEEGSNVSVTQISWERRLPSGTITVAMFNPEFGTAISQEYGKRVSFVAPSVRDATINIEGAGFADIGSYICKVVTFPLGIAEASTFVNVLDPTMATPSTSGAGTFVGGAVGGVLFLILLLILGGACFMRQCRTFRVDYYTKQYLGPSDMQTGSQLDMLQPHELQEVYRDKTSKGIQELKPKLGGDIIYPDYTPEDKDRDDWSDRGDAHSGLKEGNYYPDHSNTQNMNSCGPPVHSPIVNNGSPYLPGDCYDNGSDSDYVSYMDGSVISRREWYL